MKFLVLVRALLLGLMFLLFGDTRASADTWVAHAAGIGTLNSGLSYAAFGVGFGDTPQAAQKNALQACNKKACKITNTYNEGCFYITSANDQYGNVFWADGPTPGIAVVRVISAGATQWSEPAGGCGIPY
jgi:hypothetical protein